jgi:hypothetical protein
LKTGSFFRKSHALLNKANDEFEKQKEKLFIELMYTRKTNCLHSILIVNYGTKNLVKTLFVYYNLRNSVVKKSYVNDSIRTT